MKRITFLVTTILCVLLASTTSLFAFSGGSGGAVDPYQIANVADLQELQTTTETWKHYMLTADIDMNGETWTPLSSTSHATQFRGNINGDGHVIKNLSITSTATLYAGFILEQAGGTYIKNLGFESLTIDAPNATAVGGIIAFSWAGGNRIFDNNWIKDGTITGLNNVGALAGYMYVNSDATKTQSLKNCYAGAGVNVSGNKSVGGLFGRLALQKDGLSEAMCFFGTVAADSSASAIAGELQGAVVDIPDSYYFDATKNDPTTLSALPLGSASTGNAVALTSAQLNTETNYPALDFINVWSMGSIHPEIAGELEPYDSLLNISTSKYDASATPTGGEYHAGDSIEFIVKYVSNMNSKLTIVFKNDDPFTTQLFPKQIIDLPSSENDTVSYQVKIEIPDSVSYIGTSRISGFLGTWENGKDKYEFVDILKDTVTDIVTQPEASIVTVFPNPSTGGFNIKLQDVSSIDVYDLTGRLILRQQGSAGLNHVDLSAYKPGNYVVNIKANQHISSVLLQLQ